MSGRRLARRKRLVLQWAVMGLISVSIIAFLVLKMQPAPDPYVAGDRVDGIDDSLGRKLPADYPRIEFVETAQEAGLNFVHFGGNRSVQLPEDMGSGAAWGDYDDDGDPDLYICDFAGPLDRSPPEAPPSGGNRLYRNNGDGTFTDVTQESGTAFRGNSMGATWGDFDGDRDLDLFVTNFGRNLLFRNNGEGLFSEIGEDAGIGQGEGFWTGASWSDYDSDGDLDLYVCGYVQYKYNSEDAARVGLQNRAVVPFTLNPSSYSPLSNLLYRNDGSGHFTEVAKTAGVDNPRGRSLSASWTDLNQDGRPDLYVANDISDNALFRNNGDGTFTDVSHKANVSDYRGAMGLGVGDWDNDGDSDIFISHWIAQENALFSNLRFSFGIEIDTANLMFFDIADQVGLGQIALDYIGWGTFFFDYDNDGRQDLFVANGSTFQTDSEPKRLIGMKDLLFWNRGDDDGFFEVAAVTGDHLKSEVVGRGAAFADYDLDGDLDFVVVNHGSACQLFRNDGGNSLNWIRVRAVSESANTGAVGARVEVFVKDSHQTQEVGSQSSYLSQMPHELHFGLGQATIVDRIVVTFPSGTSRSLSGIEVNQTIQVKEGEG